MNYYDVIVIGGGQSGLAAGYYLRRSGLSFVVLDKETATGGSWQHYWKSLRLFSPAQWSSLPGTLMPGGGNYYPSRGEAIAYLKSYEEKYQIPVKRGIKVHSIHWNNSIFTLETSAGRFTSRSIVSATGSFVNPFIPKFAGMEEFKGTIIHSSSYQSAEEFRNKRVAVIGEGNSGAQILAEVSEVASTLWVTQKEPRFLADHIDGRYLFDVATRVYEAKQRGENFQPPSLGDIVMVPSVREARSRGALSSVRQFKTFTSNGLLWESGREALIDAVIFCTGFRPAVSHLERLGIINQDGRVDTVETKAVKQPGLWMVGYGSWTGFASATMIGVGRTAKRTVDEIVSYLSKSDTHTINPHQNAIYDNNNPHQGPLPGRARNL